MKGVLDGRQLALKVPCWLLMPAHKLSKCDRHYRKFSTRRASV